MLNWQNAPRRTDWGTCMKNATIALGKDATLDLYADADDLDKVIPALREVLREEDAATQDPASPIVAAAARWEYAKRDPVAVRHLLQLLNSGKGTADDLDKMVDRILLSRHNSGLYEPDPFFTVPKS